MHALEYLRQSARDEVKPIYAISGDDAFLRGKVLDAIVAAALGGQADDMAVTRFAGESAGLADVLDEVRTLPFLVKRRVVVVENADPFVTAHRRELEQYAEAPSRAGVLVLIPKSFPGNTRLAKLVDKVGTIVEAKSPGESELAGWLIHMARDEHKLKLADDSARLLVELVGAETGILAAELAKLAVYVGERATIKREDVTKMVGAGRVETIWKTLDAATTGRTGEAIQYLDRLLGAGEHPVGLLAAMSVSLRKLHYAGQLRRARVEFKEACRQAGIPTFPAALDQTQRQHAHLGPGRVDALPDWLLRADLDLKGSSQLPPRAVLERLIVRLAVPRKD